MRAAGPVSGYLKCHSKLCGSGVKDSHRLAEAGTGIHVSVMLLAYVSWRDPVVPSGVSVCWALRESLSLRTRLG